MDLVERAEEILESSQIKDIELIPEFMEKQRLLCEFARDAALYIIASQPGEKTVLDGTFNCPECGFREKHLARCSRR